MRQNWFLEKDLIISNKYQKHFYDISRKFVDEHKDLLSKGKVLVVGHGLGCKAFFINKINKNVKSIDIELLANAVLKEKVVLYKGDTMPFKDNEFDVIVCA